jgi:ubiquinone/menaquinone biosynthesis C-methylase UbiE
MQNNLRGLIRCTCICIFLIFCVCYGAFTEDNTRQDKDVSKKMNISRYDEAARGMNAPMYAYYAQKIKEKTGITKGVCLDVGSGGGYLG